MIATALSCSDHRFYVLFAAGGTQVLVGGDTVQEAVAATDPKIMRWSRSRQWQDEHTLCLAYIELQSKLFRQ